MQTDMNPREERGWVIAHTEGQLFRMDEDHYRVRSQSSGGYYSVDNTRIG